MNEFRKTFIDISIIIDIYQTKWQLFLVWCITYPITNIRASFCFFQPTYYFLKRSQKTFLCFFGYIHLTDATSLRMMPQSLVSQSSCKIIKSVKLHLLDSLQALQLQVDTLNHPCDLSMVHWSYLLSLSHQ